MYLERINSPKDIRTLSVEELKVLCAEVRDYMIQCCSENPGHLASSLGSVELIIGLHYVYDTPEDKIVFDVGHQAYAHKIITGRKDAFKTCRTKDGISGFPRRDESPYDAFGAGHSSTSISAALGFAQAARLKGTTEKAVAFIGDGALTGGLAFEGLNNAGDSSADLLIVLNDNNQSIDRNIGALHQHLLRLTTSHTYNAIKDKVWENMGETNFRNRIQRSIRNVKSGLIKTQNAAIFEALGFRYFGPIDGNDIEQVVAALQRLRRLKGPRIIHCMTTKGCGYAPAMEDPTTWHAPGRFNPQTGERKTKQSKADKYQDVFGTTLVDLARLDNRVVGITPAMATGCSMDKLEKEMPDRFFDVGIEEEHAVTFSAGLAAGGMRPFCNIYSAFSQRAYDEIIHDVALQGLPVTLCFDRAGLVGEDGATHHGAFDMAAYRSIPGMVIAAPSNELELRNMMYSSLYSGECPYIIRYPRGEGEGMEWKDAEFREIAKGKAVNVVANTCPDSESIAVLALGPVVNAAKEAASSEGKVSVWDMRFLKPVDTEVLDKASGYKAILTIEDGSLKGGLYGEVCEYMSSKKNPKQVIGIGMPDRYVRHASQKEQRHECGMDVEGIKEKIRMLLEKD